jgi:hypothetical protein
VDIAWLEDVLLGAGEKAVISLARIEGIENVLIDKSKARTIAKLFKLKPRGTLWILALANSRDMVSRQELKESVLRKLPDAPCYIILSLDADDMDKWYARLEDGFVAGNILLQGSAIGVGCWFTTGLRDDKQENYLKNKPQISGVLLTHLVNHSFTALGLRPQTPQRRRRWRCLT